MREGERREGEGEREGWWREKGEKGIEGQREKRGVRLSEPHI